MAVTTGMNLKNNVKEGRDIVHIVNDPINTTCPEQANPFRRRADYWLPRDGGWGLESDFFSG